MTDSPAIIRPMTFADYEAAVALWRATPGIGLNDSDTPAATERFLARNPGLSAVALLAEGALVGAVLCGHDGRRGYLHHLAVAPEHRRRGIARALVAHCLEGLRALGIQKCNLFLYADNEEGRRFWQHSGWSVREDLRVVQRVVM